MCRVLQRRFVGFAGTNPDNAREFRDKNFAVANFSGIGRFIDDIDHLFQLVVGDSHINFDFRQEIHAVLRAAIKLGVSFLTTKSFHFGDGQPLNANGRKRFPHVLQLERFDNYGNQLHKPPPLRIR
ncbi:hypothetical protein SARI_02471 [Salmonella enterica subsp. arizonae serovar 62:z4,z23:-]|uniref:Uncharacterized protein n=1 Tax=Salmonella arizonae (strain ATCC BAA-731 / CDC346-86 / RSK2980) TaxID=41514 RepID=A9MM08_SALAR|nr:hypothetical protein SARI_02471 [Salmonella enterica subsp. arizonae serovar 62:z4,z23:-]